MTDPNRRDVERAIERIEDSDEPAQTDGPPRDTKLLLGIDLDRFDLPDEAREYVEHAGQPDTRPPVVVAEDDADAADALEAIRERQTVGFNADNLLTEIRAGDDDSPEED